MKKTLILTALALFGLSQTPLQAADANAGASAFNAKGCVGCHGPAGKKPIPNTPAVGGKPADFVQAELAKFRSGERQNPMMTPMAAALSDDDIANLAAYLSSQ
jgi:cytochrome c553